MPTVNVAFNEIPLNVRTPGVYMEFDGSRAVKGTPAKPHKILVIGQRRSTGTIAELVAKAILSAEQAEVFFGRGSMLAAMCAAVKKNNAFTEVEAIALDEDAGGTAAAGEIAVTAASAKAGTLYLYLAGVQVKVTVAEDDSAATIATAIAAAINAKTDLPVTAAAVGADVTVTARWKGTTGNKIDIRANYFEGEELPSGVTLAITAMAGGATDPDIADVIAVLGDVQYDTIVTPFTDATNLAALEDELATRWGPMVQREGHAFAAAVGTHASLVTLGNSRNSRFLSIMGAGKSPTPPWIWASALAAVDAAETHPARPRQTLALKGILPPVQREQFTRAERDILLTDGIATHVTGPGGVVLIERLITTYQLNASSVADPTYLDITTMRTLAYLRYSSRTHFALKYPRHMLADDGVNVDAGVPVMTPKTAKAEWLRLFEQWERAGIVEDAAQFKSELIVGISPDDPNVLVTRLGPNLMNQLIAMKNQTQFLL